MEYCGKLIRKGLERRRLNRMFISGLTLVMIAGTVCDLPALNWSEAGNMNKSLERTGMVCRRPFVGKDLNIKNVCNTAFEGTTEIEIPKKTLEVNPLHFKDGGKDIDAAVIAVKEELVFTDEAVTEIKNLVPEISSEMPDVEETMQQTAVNPPAVTVPDVSIGENLPFEQNVPSELPVELPDELPEEEDSQVNQVQGFLIDDAGMIYGYVPEEIEIDSGYLALPDEGCTGILKGAFEGAGTEICEIDIPANITYIEEGVFSDIPELYSIWVGEDNPAYASVDGVLFDCGLTTLAAFPSGWIGIYEVPGNVTRLGSYAFANTKLEKLVMRACGQMETGEAVFGAGDGNGIMISAPWEYMEEYQSLFAGYNVTVQ